MMRALGLSSILDQPRAVETLRRVLAADRVPHAYLFAGRAGVGKVTTAYAWAQALNCESAPGEGCGRCSSCTRIGRDVHPDLLHLQPQGRGRQIKIEAIRALEQRTAQGPHEGRGLVVILDEADRMNPNAANALLKSLEEPRPGVYFALVTARPPEVPITLRSRSQVLRFGPLSEAALRQILAMEAALPAAQVESVVRLADGSARSAVWFATHAEFPVWLDWAERLSNLRRRAGSPGPPTIARQLADEVDDLPPFLRLLLGRLRDHLMLAAGVDAGGRRLTQLDPEGPEAAAARLTAPGLVLRRLQAVQTQLRDLEWYVNKSLALERMIANMEAYDRGVHR